MARVLRRACALGILAAVAGTAAGSNRRSTLLPHLRHGQALTYQIRVRVNKQTRSESRVAMPGMAESGPVDVNRVIRAEVVEVAAANPRTKLVLRVQVLNPAEDESRMASKTFELAFRHDGTAVSSHEAAELSADDTTAWQAWLARFAQAWTLPEKGVKPGDKWNAAESIAGTPLAGLYWKKESQYVREDQCPAARAASERCAVLVTTATLKQRSSPREATPDEYRLRQLKTTGKANGRNEVFTYISLSNGIVVRSSEDAAQFMDVVIAKSDGSNRVHFNVDAKSSTEMLLVPETR